jgi:enoyl-CoA hydratase
MMSAGPKTIGVDTSASPIASLWLNRPDRRNAMTHEMADEFSAAIDQLNRNDTVRVVLVRGAGESFSSGGDFTLFEELAAIGESETRDTLVDFYNKFLHVRELRTISIAVVQGAAVGAGVGLAMACDLRIAATDAVFGFTFTRLGLHPGMGATYLLPKLVGWPRALEILAAGRSITGVEAAAIGLCQRAVPPGSLGAQALALADEIASAAPLAVRALKKGFWDDRDSLGPILEREAACQAASFHTADFREGVAALRAGRKPKFSGR